MVRSCLTISVLFLEGKNDLPTFMWSMNIKMKDLC